MRLIDADELLEIMGTRYCENCERRKGIRRGKKEFIYEIGDVPCRACDIGDAIGDIDDAPTIEAEPVVRCKDCVYYEHEVDDPHKSNCQRLWGGMIDCKPESYCSDGITIEDYKRKMALRVNALMDGGEK
jgi:hypothetical protein